MEDEEPQFVRFLQTNDAPSEDAVREVTDLLVAPWQHLAYRDAEIQRLSDLLDQAQWRRTQIVNFINTYGIILSPIRRIPPNILHKIFSYCLPTDRNPAMSTLEAPLILTQICKSWRIVALSCRCIWARMHIPICYSFDRNSEILDHDGFQAKNLFYYETMQRRCEHIQTWLSRSAPLPISISIDYSFAGWTPGETQSEWEHKIVKKLFETLAPFASRWKDMEIQLPADLYDDLEATLPVENLSSLRNLKVSISRWNRASGSSSFALVHAPGLQTIALHGRELARQFPSLVTWNTLTHFCSEELFEVKDALHLLKHSPNLIYCQLSLVAGQNDSQEAESQSSICLSFLRTFRILDTNIPTSSATLLDSLDAPRLRWLDYRKLETFEHLPGNIGEISRPLIRFLDRPTNSLTKLTFDPHLAPLSDVMAFLRALKHLKHLVLGKEPAGPTRSIKDTPGAYHPRRFPLDLLIPDGEPESSDDRNSEILLPSLEIFESIGISGFSEEILSQFIEARIRFFSAGKVSLLSRIRVKFRQSVGKAEMGTTFWRAVRDCAEKAGVMSSLYVEKHHEERDGRPGFLSPYYGVENWEITWDRVQYLDKGNFETVMV